MMCNECRLSIAFYMHISIKPAADYIWPIEFVTDEIWHENKQVLQDMRKANLAAGRDEYEGCCEALGFEVEDL